MNVGGQGQDGVLDGWWTGVEGGSKVGGEAWLDLGGQGISGGRKQQPAIYRKMIKIIVAGVIFSPDDV